MSVGKTTRIQAVNLMLSQVALQPVSSLEDSSDPDVSLAEQILDEICGAVLSDSWWFNTERNIPLVPQVDGTVIVPPEYMSVGVNPCNAGGLTNGQLVSDVVERSGKLYDLANHTFTFIADTVKVDVLLALEFTDLPQIVRRYINIRAARVYQNRLDREVSVNAFQQQDERRALEKISAENTRRGSYNIFKAPLMRGIKRRSVLDNIEPA